MARQVRIYSVLGDGEEAEVHDVTNGELPVRHFLCGLSLSSLASVQLSVCHSVWLFPILCLTLSRLEVSKARRLHCIASGRHQPDGTTTPSQTQPVDETFITLQESITPRLDSEQGTSMYIPVILSNFDKCIRYLHHRSIYVSSAASLYISGGVAMVAMCLVFPRRREGTRPDGTHVRAIDTSLQDMFIVYMLRWMAVTCLDTDEKVQITHMSRSSGAGSSSRSRQVHALELHQYTQCGLYSKPYHCSTHGKQ